MRRIHSDDVIGQSSQTNDRPEIRRHSEQNTVTTPTRKQSSSSSFTNRYQVHSYYTVHVIISNILSYSLVVMVVIQ